MNKLEVAKIEIEELAFYNQHAEVVIALAEYTCDKHYNMKGVKVLIKQANDLKAEQDRIGYLTENLKEKRQQLIHDICNLLDDNECETLGFGGAWHDKN